MWKKLSKILKTFEYVHQIYKHAIGYPRMLLDSVGSIVTFEKSIDFSGKHRGFDFDFFGSHNVDRI